MCAHTRCILAQRYKHVMSPSKCAQCPQCRVRVLSHVGRVRVMSHEGRV